MFGRFKSVPAAAVISGILGSLLWFASQASAATVWSASLSESIVALPVGTELRTGYSRDLFPHWIDTDGDCQNARAEVLIAESLDPVTFTTTSRCTVSTGRWFSYYDAQTSNLASDFDIDHMVPLAEAWDSGAHSWTLDERRAFANDLADPRSLIAVTDDSNVAKSDADPAQWLPAFERCRYAGEWVAVKIRWGLTVDSAEKNALATLASSCPQTTLTVVIARGTGPTPPPTTTTTTTTTTTAPPSSTSLTGVTRIVGTAKYADLRWTGSSARFDLWRGSTRLLAGTAVTSHTDRVSKSTSTATYTVCPAGSSRTAVSCSSVTLRW